MQYLHTTDPFQRFVALSDELENFFPRACARNTETPLARWTPAVDVWENAEGIRMAIELPGLKREQVKVTLENNILAITGQREWNKETNKENCHRVERAYGSFARTFTLPATVSAENVKAEMKDGVLNLFLPKREEAKPRQIDVAVH